jgi:PAS domain-containing protein
MSHAPLVAARTPDVVSGVDDPLFTLLFEQSPLYVGVVEWLGDDARYLAVNPATAARLGRPAAAIRGRRARELGLPTDACAAWANLYAQAVARGAPVRAEWEATTEDGRKSFRTMRLRASPT